MIGYTLREPAPPYVHTALSHYPEFLRELLYARGIDTREAAECFLEPDYERDSHDPFLLTDMERAVSRIAQALKDRERVVVFADYDHDGIPAGALLNEFFKAAGHTKHSVYIPHRNKEGFGLSVKAVERFAKDGVGLVITVDCGITSHEAVARASELGLDVVVTDHHQQNGTLPEAYAIINPKRDGDTYPCKELCGAGVAFKVVQALIEKGVGSLSPGWEKNLLVFAALATIGDMVPLVDENRMLVHYGLKELRRTKYPGLVEMFRDAKLKQGHLSEDDVAFMIVPRINAASRLDAPEQAYELLSADDEKRARELVSGLTRINNERKGVVAAVVKEARRRLDARDELSKVIVLGNPKWQPGVLGLAANALLEEYERPVFLWGRGEAEDIKGSCRAAGSDDLVSLMNAAPKDTFIDFGGHTRSGGFSIESEKLHTLEEKLSSVYTGNNKAAKEKVLIDKELLLGAVTWDTYGMIERLAPFGVGNPKPLFLFSGVLLKQVASLGKHNKHTRLVLEGEAGTEVEAIGFFMSPEQFNEGEEVELVAHIEKSVFRGRPELRLRIVDVQ